MGGTLKLYTLFAFFVSISVQLVYPLTIALAFRRRTRVSWQPFLSGAFIFVVFQLLTWLPLKIYLDTAFGSRYSSDTWEFFWLLALAFVTSLIVEAGRWIGYRYLFPRGAFRLSWRNGVMYTLGYAAAETMLLIAGLTFIWLLAYAILSQVDLEALIRALGGEASPSLRKALQDIIDTRWPEPLVVAVERVLDLPHQIAWSLLVMQSLIRDQKRWFGFSVLYHTSIAVIVPVLAGHVGFWVAEWVNLVLASLSLWIGFKMRFLCVDE